MGRKGLRVVPQGAASGAANGSIEHRLPNGPIALHDQLGQMFAACPKLQLGHRSSPRAISPSSGS